MRNPPIEAKIALVALLGMSGLGFGVGMARAVSGDDPEPPVEADVPFDDVEEAYFRDVVDPLTGHRQRCLFVVSLPWDAVVVIGACYDPDDLETPA